MPETTSLLERRLGLREQPFAATADPRYFYATQEHKQCLFRLWNSIDGRQGIAVVMGNYGTGKTTLLRKLLSGMQAKPDKYLTAVIGTPVPAWTTFSLLETVVSQFAVRPRRRTLRSYMESLYRFLVDHRGYVTTLVIDDAQNLNKRGQLEMLRLIQNLETSQRKLLNLVFFSQLEWARVLRAAPNFEQRIDMTYTLGTLGIEESRELIHFRLKQAGAGPNGPIFEEGAVRAIHAYADGVIRPMITLCRNALLAAAQMNSPRITQAIVLHTIQKTTLPDRERRARVAEAIQMPGGSEPMAGPAPRKREAPARLAASAPAVPPAPDQESAAGAPPETQPGPRQQPSRPAVTAFRRPISQAEAKANRMLLQAAARGGRKDPDESAS